MMFWLMLSHHYVTDIANISESHSRSYGAPMEKIPTYKNEMRAIKNGTELAMKILLYSKRMRYITDMV